MKKNKPITRVGLIGCGRISDIYLKTLSRFEHIEVVSCASLDIEESKAKAQKFNIKKAQTPDELIKDESIDLVLNLTVPKTHFEVSFKAIHAGKHVYSEKPLSTSMKDAQTLTDLARNKGVYLGCAPDTFFGNRWQTVRKLIDAGEIGTPTGIFSFVGTHGTERHHPNPDFYYKDGGGPLMDLGPYYLSLMVFLFGSIVQVSGLSNRAFQQRKIENGARNGENINVHVDTHVQAMLSFESGLIGSMTMSFDVWDSETPRFEIYGTEGVICVSDPDPVHGANIFQGDVWLRKQNNSRWSHQPRPLGRENWEIPDNLHNLSSDNRGVGLVEMVSAIEHNTTHRASDSLAIHTLEAMLGIIKSSNTHKFINLNTKCERPAPLPENFNDILHHGMKK